MTVHDCPCCECFDEEREPTPEELAAQHERADERLSVRMTPARDAVEQMERDIAAAEARMAALIDADLHRGPAPHGMAGLSEWLTWWAP